MDIVRYCFELNFIYKIMRGIMYGIAKIYGELI